MSVSYSCDKNSPRKKVFSNNMRKKFAPENEITDCKESENWTKVSFKPDLFMFNMTKLDEDDVVALMKKRVLEMAASLGEADIKVKLNGEPVPVKSFVQYVDLYLGSVLKRKKLFLPRFVKRVKGWDICV